MNSRAGRRSRLDLTRMTSDFLNPKHRVDLLAARASCYRELAAMGDHGAPQAVGANAKWNALQPADIENFSDSKPTYNAPLERRT
jgi:hypothetical protein